MQPRPTAITRNLGKDRAIDDQSNVAASSRRTDNAEPATRVDMKRFQKPPMDLLSYDDWHDTRATNDPTSAKLYADLRREKRKNDWHRLAMRSSILIVWVTTYLAAFWVLQTAMGMQAGEAKECVGIALTFAGMAVAGSRFRLPASSNSGRQPRA
jgi:hypothetical protein